MSVKEIVASVAEDCGFTQKDVKLVIDLFFEKLSSGVAELEEKEKISVPGFGAWTIVNKPARTARNPKTGEAVQVAPCTKVKFKPAKEFRDLVND